MSLAGEEQALPLTMLGNLEEAGCILNFDKWPESEGFHHFLLQVQQLRKGLGALRKVLQKLDDIELLEAGFWDAGQHWPRWKMFLLWKALKTLKDGIIWNPWMQMEYDGIPKMKIFKTRQECNTSVPQVYTGRIPPAGSKSANQSNQLIPLHLPPGRGGDLQPSEQQLCCNGSGGKGRSLKFKGCAFEEVGPNQITLRGYHSRLAIWNGFLEVFLEMMKLHLELWGDATWFPWHWSIGSLGCVSCCLPGESSRGRKRR